MLEIELRERELELEILEIEMHFKRKEAGLEGENPAFAAVEFVIDSFEPDDAVKFLSEIAEGECPQEVKQRIHLGLAEMLVDQDRIDDAKPYLKAVIQGRH